MPFRYQIALELEEKPCVVVGGGTIGEHKTHGLLDAGASVTVISATFTNGLRSLAAQGAIKLVERDYRDGDLSGAFLAIAATDNEAVNEAIFREAERAGVLLNTVDDIPRSHFAVPAIVRRGELRVAISTGGKAPALAKRLRMQLERELGPEYEELIDLLGDAREDALPRTIPFDEWAQRWQRALDHDLLGMIREGRIEEARRAVDACLNGTSPERTIGKVTLVGAGPGDPDLITVKGRKALNAADVIVHDRLAHFAPNGTRCIDVGKRGGEPSSSQAEINALLIELAREGLDVVRLKGGDPFVFGRGGEEVSALRAAGIDCEVISAPSSAIAVPAAAGIPVTDRRASSSFTVISGHDVASVDWSSLRTDTVVVLMGARTLASTARAFIDAGRDPSTPAAIIADGTLPTQRVIVDDLGGFAERGAPLTSQPQVFVVGDVVAFADVFAGPRSSEEGILVAVLDAAGADVKAIGLSESVTLATCERTEIYGIGTEFRSNDGAIVLRGIDAERHLFRVAAGLESRVVGERHILGQVRRALKQAKEASSAGPVLSDLFARAIATGRKVRAATELGSVKHGIGSLVASNVGNVDGKTGVIVGTGEAASDVASALSEAGASLKIVGRTLANAQRVAGRFNGEAFEMNDLAEVLRHADFAVVAVRGGIAVDAGHVALRQRPLRVIDVSVPAAVQAGANLQVQTLSDLSLTQTPHLHDAILQAEEMIEKALAHSRVGSSRGSWGAVHLGA